MCYIIDVKENIMPKQETIILPKTQEILSIMGEQIKMARLRRNLPSDLVAKRAGISRATVSAIEQGKASVSIGSYAAVLHALNGMDENLLLIAKDDELGRKLQDIALPQKARIRKKKGNSNV